MLTAPILPFGLTALDLIGFGAFILLWLGYGLFVDLGPWRERSLNAAMNHHRLAWMTKMVERDMRIGDTNLVGNLMRSISFLASTSLLILGGLAAAMGALQEGYDLLRSLPFTIPTTRELFELKIVVIAAIFVYSFFKFTWSLRQFNYCCILIGAAPEAHAEPLVKQAYAEQAAQINGLGARSFNEGLRGYYFALALASWFIHPLALVMASALVVVILLRREFGSKTLRALRPTTHIGAS